MNKTSAVRLSRFRKIVFLLLTLTGVLAAGIFSYAATMTVSTRSLTLTKGKSSVITISNVDNVSYVYDNSKVIKCSLGSWNNSTFPLKVEALEEGTAAITIKDNNNGTSIDVSVTVTNKAKAQSITALKLKNNNPCKIAKKKMYITFKLAKAQKSVKVQVLNANDKVVWQKICKSVPGGKATTIAWNGKNTKGKKVAVGFYRVKVIAGKKSKLSSWFQAKR